MMESGGGSKGLCNYNALYIYKYNYNGKHIGGHCIAFSFMCA